MYTCIWIPMYTRAIVDPTWVQSGSVQHGPYTHVYPCHALEHCPIIVVHKYTHLLSPTSLMKFAFTMAVITVFPVRLTCLYIVYITFNTL